MLPFHRRFRRGFYALLARGFLLGARMTPTALGRLGGRWLARAALTLRGRERRLAQANLARVFAGEDPRRVQRIWKRAVDCFGDNFFDALTLDRRQRAGFADVDDGGALETLMRLRAEGRGILILSGHMGCWELLGAWLAHVLEGLTVVTGTIHNPAVDRMINDRRRSLGITPVPRDGDLRPLMRCLSTGGAAAVLMDQNTRVENRAVPFFGSPAPTARGFAQLALRTGAPVLPLAIARRGAGHVVEHLEPLRFGAENTPAGEQAILETCNRALEKLILRNPAEWVWFHQRWNEPTPKTLENEA